MPEDKKFDNLTPEEREDLAKGLNSTFDDPEFPEKFGKKFDAFLEDLKAKNEANRKVTK